MPNPSRWISRTGPMLLAGFVIAALTPDRADANNERVPIHSYRDVEALFDKLGYTPEKWQAGVREVPRLFVTHMPERWREKNAEDVTVLGRERLFFRLMAPLVLRANELIAADRQRAAELKEAAFSREPVPPADAAWLKQTAARYGILSAPGEKLTGNKLDNLLMRIDTVPPSLALAQAAEESGWGTARFADLGNALFGQWTWRDGKGGEKDTEPKARRAGRGDHRIAEFETPLDSVMDYMQTLNTHPAYADLRAKRAELRDGGQLVSGWALADTLATHSERGRQYVRSLHTIMRVNKLDVADVAYLADGAPVYLIPEGAGAE